MPADNQILILDLFAASQKHFTDMFNRLGYAATRIDSFAAAQSAMAADPQAILIVALRAADAQSTAQLAELRASQPDCRIIAVGARALSEAQSAWRAGADDYLPRPVQDDALIAALDRVSKLHMAREQRLPANAQTTELVHQINNPLTPILGMADLLLDELPTNHPGREYAQAILTAAMRIRDVVRRLADTVQPND